MRATYMDLFGSGRATFARNRKALDVLGARMHVKRHDELCHVAARDQILKIPRQAGWTAAHIDDVGRRAVAHRAESASSLQPRLGGLMIAAVRPNVAMACRDGGTSSTFPTKKFALGGEKPKAAALACIGDRTCAQFDAKKPRIRMIAQHRESRPDTPQ